MSTLEKANRALFNLQFAVQMINVGRVEEGNNAIGRCEDAIKEIIADAPIPDQIPAEDTSNG
jgi:hypothetical protein